MPKAKQKRKGIPPELQLCKRPKIVHDPGPDLDHSTSIPENVSTSLLDIPEDASTSLLDIPEEVETSLLDIPEEVVCLILDHLQLYSVSAVERTCKQLQTLIMHARVWRKILFKKIEMEPLIEVFISSKVDWQNERDSTPENMTDELLDESNRTCKGLLKYLVQKLDYIWLSDQPPTVTRNSDIYNVNEKLHFLYHIQSTGKYFLAFWGPMKTDSRSSKDYIVNIFDRVTGQLVKKLTNLHGKPDLVRVVDDLDLVLLSYPSYLMVELVRLVDASGQVLIQNPDTEEEGEDVMKDNPPEYLDLGVPGDGVTGSVCDIVVRENVMLRGVMFRRVVLVAINSEPMENRVIHIGEIQLFSLRQEGGVMYSRRLWGMEFRPVPIGDGGAGTFFNQCIQKKGLCDFNSDHAVVVIGGREGSAVLAVLDVPKMKICHRLQLRGDTEMSNPNITEGGCEGGACQYSVVSLMIDRVHPEMCAVLLSTGQLNVIHLASGDTVFHRHLQFDGQLKLALHQPKFTGAQRIAVKFRNFVSFYDLTLSRVKSDIQLNHVRTLRITSVDGRETRLDDNPSQELRKQFGELQRRVRALNNYTSGIQKKLDKGLRPGTVTQGVMSMTRKVQLVTSKLDQAHGKAREIEAIVIASIAFDNRFCHALTLNRDLVVFDMLGADGDAPYVYMDVDESDDPTDDDKGFPVAGPSSINTRSSMNHQF